MPRIIELKETDDGLISFYARTELDGIIAKEVAAEREACAKIADSKAAAFASPGYSTNQPRSSVRERFACKIIADAIRNRG